MLSTSSQTSRSSGRRSGRPSRVDRAVAELIAAMAAAAPTSRSNGESVEPYQVYIDHTLEQVRTGAQSILQGRSRADRLRPALRQKIRNWLISFHHLDPRYKLLTFFNLVASDGADNLVNEEDPGLLTDEFGDGHHHHKHLTKIEQMLKDAFTLSGVFTVWRPCSNDAMRKMMLGAGVGKGLDIKGKSAKRGTLSGYVPFLQIHEESHKAAVVKPGRKAKLRVYFKSREAREAVMDELEPLGNDYMEFDPQKVIPSEMIELDHYAKQGYYGLELYQRLFWQGYVVDRAIERSEQDGTATGRPSVPGFQDANLKTLKTATAALPKPNPLPVVFQSHESDPMNPLYLLMAYEENGTIQPVVSDFDAFLLGWRREALWFGCNLPRDQEDLMLWCVDRVEEILDAPPSTDSWTVRWLEVLKENNPEPDIPPYGFGDPKSYGIMEAAAQQLIDTGAVRHGSECFNFYFPQEIDDTLLIVSDTLKPVPWKYVNVKELQSLLSKMIWDGFVFPINPKWILCDPGWKRLYDQLMASDALYSEYTKDVWYPPTTGIREKIDRIAAKHPKGFQRKREVGKKKPDTEKYGYSPLRQEMEQGLTLSGESAVDLAELELEKFNSHRKRQQSIIMRKSKKSAELQQDLAPFLRESYNDISGLEGDLSDLSDVEEDEED